MMHYDSILAYLHTTITRRSDSELVVTVPMRPQLRDYAGTGVHLAPILAAIDMAGGLCTAFACESPRWTITSDMDVHLLDRDVVGPIEAVGTCVRAGTRSALARVQVVDAGRHRNVIAVATLNHAVITPPEPSPFAHMRPGDHVSMEPAPAWSRLHITDAFPVQSQSDGGLYGSMDVDDRTRNLFGVLHGAMLATLAVNAVDAAVLDSVNVRFIDGVGRGPAVAAVTDTFDRESGRVVQVQIRAAGSDDAACTAVLSTRLTAAG